MASHAATVPAQGWYRVLVAAAVLDPEPMAVRDAHVIVWTNAAWRLVPEAVVAALDRARRGDEIAANGRVWRAHEIPVADGCSVVRLREVTEESRLLQRYHVRATSDALTGLATRGVFDHGLRRAVAVSARTGVPVSVLLVDVDGLKAVNDSIGHRAGDTLLRRAADAVRVSTRAGDVTARIGGDEFAVVAPGADASAAYDVGRRVVREADARGVSVSVGCAEVERTDHANDAGAAALASADAALYVAKRSGGGHCVAGSPQSPA